MTKSELYKSAMERKRDIVSASLSTEDAAATRKRGNLYPIAELEVLLNRRLKNRSVKELTLRARAKMVRSWVARTLGYPEPEYFNLTDAHLIAQRLDVYVQASGNLQIWNQGLVKSRRYAVVRIMDDKISCVRVMQGRTLARMAANARIAKKYQARIKFERDEEVLTINDTDRIEPLVAQKMPWLADKHPAATPAAGEMIGIKDIFRKVRKLVGKTVPYVGATQDAVRTKTLAESVASLLGYDDTRVTHQFPTIPHQALQVKLQLSSTVDVGATRADSRRVVAKGLNGLKVRRSDCRWAIFTGERAGQDVKLTGVSVVTGEDFYNRFTAQKSKTPNKKIQISLPVSFFKR